MTKRLEDYRTIGLTRVVPREVIDSRPFEGESFLLVNQLDLTFHLVPQNYFDSLDPQIDYVPEPFAVDGFVHCTDGADEMARTANRYYQSSPAPHYYLYIDKARVRPPIRYDADPPIYPHIYGALNRDAIVAVRPAKRNADGTFLPPESFV